MKETLRTLDPPVDAVPRQRPIAGQPIASRTRSKLSSTRARKLWVDYCLNLKAINPSPIDGSGIYSAVSCNPSQASRTRHRDQLSKRTRRFRYADDLARQIHWPTKRLDCHGCFHTLGLLQASYWHKLSPQVEVAADLQLIATPMKRDAVATVGAKWDLRLSSFKAQLDSTGKLSALLEQRLAPNFALLFTGEIDHFKNTAKVGMGIMLEANAAPYDEEMMASLPPQL
ncbi:SubName: Full=Probable TOM40-mitochondrial import receptor (MOM38) {ECO:0000313/EMBL:CCA68912.1} [Serendipita indica DSM 11827]|nr:SubName: Full=Probable TOM40-mitochondrial import receptor (MOM38) {ECO:0000313/EMBL:CCA68912.1} [Serendipita indica DSM 11827]